MDRPLIQTGEGLRSADVLYGWRAAMVGNAKLAGAILGQATLVTGLPCTPGTGLQVSLGAGEIYSPVVVDAATYGTLAADAHVVMKQGQLADPVALSTPAPGTAGRSINYLVEVQFQENDTTNTLLPFYDSANPTVTMYANGNTLRQDICAVQIKAGTSATTGTQTTPAPDAGWTGLWVVTIANGAVSVVPGNITAYANAPFLTASLARMLGHLYRDTGGANALAIVMAPALTAWVDGLTIAILVNTNSTGACTLNAGPSAKSLKRCDGAALQAGDLRAGENIVVVYDATADLCRLVGLVPSQLAGTGLKADGAGALQLDIHSLPAEAALAGTEEFAVWDITAAAYKKATPNQVAAIFSASDAQRFDTLLLSGGGI